MSRTIPAALQTHLNQAATTTTRLIKITLKDGTVFGLSMLDADVEYNDGGGAVTYKKTNGFDPSTLASDLGYSVANAEAFSLISDEVDAIDLEMVQAGEFDDATWICYLVNWRDLTMGHAILDAGDLGEVRARHGMIWFPELLSYVMRLRQPVGGVWSRTCRATFGSPADSQNGCGVDLAPLWRNDTVSAVGGETNRVFTGTTFADSPGIRAPLPGRVEWLTGDNEGQESAVEELAGEVVTLAEPVRYPISIGDTFRIRPDCGKRYLEDCRDVWDNALNFKGEPLIPVGDASAIQAPGAQLPRAGGYLGRAQVLDDDS